MKTGLLAVVTLSSLIGLARAEEGDSVKFYGILDVAVGTMGYSANVSPLFPGSVNPVSKTKNATNDPVWGMFNGGISDSRWGLRGNANLEGGLHAFFDLESGINVPTGNINNAAGGIAGASNVMAAASALSGQLFNRGAYVGLKQDMLGSLALGRTPTFGLEVIGNYDPLFGAQLFSPLGFSGSYSAGGITEGSRTDNNIKYTNKVGPVNFGVSYSLGGDTGSIQKGSTFGAILGYEANNFGIQATYYTARDEVHSGAAVGANPVDSTMGLSVGSLTLNNDQDYMVAAKYSFLGATIKAGWENYQLKRPSDTAAAGATVDYYGYSGKLTNTTTPSTVNVFFAGGDYKFTPQFDVAVGFWDTHTDTTTGVKSGDQIQYSLLADYHLMHRTDVYTGLMYSQFSGDAFIGYQPKNYIFALGFRKIFG